MLTILRTIAEEAGRRIRDCYPLEPEVTFKSDDSPVTAADRAANAVIVEALTRNFPGVPVLSEESRLPDFEERRTYTSYFLVDPLDGTREFLKRNGEFTVNIAYCEEAGPVAGVVHAPILASTHYGQVGKGAFVRRGVGQPVSLVGCGRPDMSRLRTAVSRSHPSERLADLLAAIPNLHRIPLGSSLKMVKVADGTVDFYMRIGRLMEWDTAAACGIMRALEIPISDLEGEPIRYNKASLDHAGVLISASERLQDYLLSLVNMT